MTIKITPEIQKLLDSEYNKGLNDAKEIASQVYYEGVPRHEYEPEYSPDTAWDIACSDIENRIGYLIRE